MAATVYFTREVTPEKVVELYQRLGVELPGKVAATARASSRTPPSWASERVTTSSSRWHRPDGLVGDVFLSTHVRAAIVPVRPAPGAARRPRRAHRAHGNRGAA